MRRVTTGTCISKARRARKVTQVELARRAGISPAGVKAYERDARHPSQSALGAIAAALGLPGEEIGELMAAAGYVGGAPPREMRVRTLEELGAELAACVWPAFVTNQAMDVIAANNAMERAFGVGPENQLTGFGERNFFAGITHARFASRLENWNEVATYLIGLAKGDPRYQPDDDRPLPWFETAVARVLSGDPARVARLIELWEEAPPIPPALRFRYRIRWRDPAGTLLSFNGITMLEDPATELHWNEWFPADVETWQWCAAG